MSLPNSESGSQYKICVVLGGSGFLGQRLCRKLVDEGYHVRSVSRSGKPKSEPESWWSNVEWIAAPIGSQLCADALRNVDLLFHLASTTFPSTSDRDIAYDLESNLIATVKTLEAAAVAGVHRVVFISSGGTVYGKAQQLPILEDHSTNPICSYGVHKLAIEKYLHIFRSRNKLQSIVLRVANMYGEFQDLSRPLGAVAHFTALAAKGQPVQVWGDGFIVRDYVHVDDVAEAARRAAVYEGTEHLFNVGTGRGVSLNQLIEIVRDQVDIPVVVDYKAHRSFDVPSNVLDSSLAKRELGWTPDVSLEAGIARLIQLLKISMVAS